MPLVDVNKLRRDKEKLKTEMKSLCSTALGREDKRMTEQEGARYQELENLVRALDGQIELAERNNALEMENPANTDSNDGADGKRDEFQSDGDFLMAVRSHAISGKMTPQLEKRVPTGMNTMSPQSAGFLVGTDKESSIMKRTYEKSVLANKCRTIVVGAGSNGTSWFELDETSRVTGSRNGGVRAYFVAEGDTVTASRPKFLKKKLDLSKLMALVYMTEEQLQDAQNIESETDALVGDEFAWVLDDALFNGNGAGVPLGILNSNALVTVAKEAGQVAGSIVYENITKMWSRMWAPSRANSVWYINQDCEQQLNTMALVVGAGGVPVYLPAGGVSATPYSTLYGRPVVPIEQAKTCGTVGDIVLADFSQYKLVTKGNLKKDMSMHVEFLKDENVFRWVKRVNGTPMWSTAVTPANGTNTLSPFVALATRA